MDAQSPGFWTTLAANEEFWKQLPYWVTAIAGVGGTLFGTWIGAKLNHTSALHRERESRRRQHLERILDIAGQVISDAVDFEGHAVDLRQTIDRTGGTALDDLEKYQALIESHLKLMRTMRLTMEADALTRIMLGDSLRKHLQTFQTKTSQLMYSATDIDDIRVADLTARFDSLTAAYEALLNHVVSLWHENR